MHPTSFKPHLQTQRWAWNTETRAVRGTGRGGERLPRSLAGVLRLARGLSAGGRGWAQGASRGLCGDGSARRGADREAPQRRSRPAAGRNGRPPEGWGLGSPCPLRCASERAEGPRTRRQRIRQAPGQRRRAGRQSAALKDRELKKNDFSSLSPQTWPPVNRF